MNTPKYTFLLPAYKGRFLREMLDSIQGQSYTNFKVLISDDCSPEDLYSICKPYLDDPRFEYRRNESNIGSENLVNHWNMLVDMCETEYLVMASDDDVYYPNYLEEIDKLLLKYPKADLASGRLQRIDTSGCALVDGLAVDEYVDHLHFVYNYLQDIHSLQNHCYRTSSLKELGGFIYYKHAWYSDDATNIFMSKNGCVSTQDVVFGFRSSDIQISASVDTKVVGAKIDATLAYDKWFCKYVNDVLSSSSDFLNLSLAISSRHKERTRCMLNDLLVELDFLPFAEKLFKLCGQHIVSIKVVLYRWVKKHF